MSSQKLSNTTSLYWGYDDIPLKLYFEIAKEGDFNLMLKEGKFNIEDALNRWEEIVKQNEEESGSSKYKRFFRDHKSYAKLLHKYLITRTQILILFLELDKEIVEELRKENYFVNLKDGFNSISYRSSLLAALSKSNHLVNKITLKQNEIKNAPNQESRPLSFEQVMANLSSNIGFSVPDNITLSRYNQYSKIIKAKESEANKLKNTNGRRGNRKR